MANVTDPLVSSVEGSDPQNCMEYITRQKIYDSRYWKEDCFGLTVADVLERAIGIVGGGGGTARVAASSSSQKGQQQKQQGLQCVGGLPAIRFLALTLKLLQLHPDTDLVVQTFVEQDEFKYVRALGALYVRLTARPAAIYTALEPCLADFRKLRCYLHPYWKVITVDEFVHQLLLETHILGIALPRLPSRRVLEQAGYLDAPPSISISSISCSLSLSRPTALGDILAEEQFQNNPLAYLEYKVKVEKSPAAMEFWERRLARLQQQQTQQQQPTLPQKSIPSNDAYNNDHNQERNDNKDNSMTEATKPSAPRKKKHRGYDNLFTKKQQQSSSAAAAAAAAALEDGEEEEEEQGGEAKSDEYWNEQRAKLGLKPLNHHG